MSILKVAKLGNPILRESAGKVPRQEISSREIQCLIQNMIETMREYQGVGLAAPQVHESLQIIVIEELAGTKGEAETPLTVLVNPSLSVISERQFEDWEGCLSIPDLRGLVPRYEQIEVQGYNPLGQTVRFQARGFYARVIQHECDHLEGKVFLERMRNLESLTYLQEFSRYWQKEEEE
ncbi:MAG: peptide deformylase [Acidobacteriota bacterium]